MKHGCAEYQESARRSLPEAQGSAKRQHRSVSQEVTHLLSARLETAKPLSILELKGLGKEQWLGIDPAKHVQRERASWD
jgi:hypothetical protein